MGVSRTMRSELRLVLTRSKELPELAGARSGLRNEIPQFIADRALEADESNLSASLI
jgi:hypothetical protein